MDFNNIDTNYKILGSRITKFRKEAGHTQKQLADKLGISQQLMANYELGQRRIHALLLIQLAKALYVSIDDLLGINKNKPGPMPKIQKILYKIMDLPLNKQKLIIKAIDTLIKGVK